VFFQTRFSKHSSFSFTPLHSLTSFPFISLSLASRSLHLQMTSSPSSSRKLSPRSLLVQSRVPLHQRRHGGAIGLFALRARISPLCVCVCVCVCACVRGCVRGCMGAWVRVCVRALVRESVRRVSDIMIFMIFTCANGSSNAREAGRERGGEARPGRNQASQVLSILPCTT